MGEKRQPKRGSTIVTWSTVWPHGFPVVKRSIHVEGIVILLCLSVTSVCALSHALGHGWLFEPA